MQQCRFQINAGTIICNSVADIMSTRSTSIPSTLTSTTSSTSSIAVGTRKFVPVIVTMFRPPDGPEEGEIVVNVGTAMIILQ